MNLFADIRGLVDRQPRCHDRGGRLARRARSRRRHGRAAARCGAWRHGDQCRDGAGASPPAWRPRDIAEALAARLAADPRIASAEVAGPGFLNLRLAPGASGRAWSRRRWPRAPTSAGPTSARGGGSTSSSSRPTRPGRCMSAMSAARSSATRWRGLLAFAGYEVTREYYINDGGAQVDVLARSAYERYREANGLEPEIARGALSRRLPDPGRRGAEGEIRRQPARQARSGLAGRGARLRHRGDDGDDPRRSGAARRARWTSIPRKRRSTAPAGSRRRSTTLRGMGLIYEGMLEPPKGKLPEDWEPREQTLFRSTALWRRRRPAGEEVRRQLDLFRPRHRLSLRQGRARLRRADRRARRRSRRLCQADEGGGRGAVGRPRAAGRQADASWSSCARTASRSRCASAPAPS